MEIASANFSDRIGGIARAHAERTTYRPDNSFLIGLIGRGIARSKSPAMHEREGQRLGLGYTYALIDFDRLGLADGDLGDVLDAVERAGFAGVNITHPFKQAVITHLTDLAPDASAIGAVNTVVFARGRRVGHNTDCYGFAESFRRQMAGCALDKVVLFGAGGAGAAVAHALLQLGVSKLDLHDPVEARALELARKLSARFGRTVDVNGPTAVMERADGAVNATPVGMSAYPGTPFDPALLSPRQWLADIVYFPAETELLRRAQSIGCRTLPGAGMAVFQAAQAFELFTGVAPDADAMAGHFGAAV